MSKVEMYFPSSTGVSIIAEPGSFFVSSAFTLAVNVISKEVVARDRKDQEHGQCCDSWKIPSKQQLTLNSAFGRQQQFHRA